MTTQRSRALTFLDEIGSGRIQVSADTVALAAREVMVQSASHMSSGLISARRMARAFDTSFEAMNASFRHHAIPYEIGL